MDIQMLMQKFTYVIFDFFVYALEKKLVQVIKI